MQAIKFHPGMALLEQYTDGSLHADIALAVAAHIDLCPQCQQLHQDLNNDYGTQLEQADVMPADDNLQDMLQHILQHDQAVATPLHHADAEPIVVNQRQFMLPRSLQRLGKKHGKWLTLGGIATAKIPAGADYHVSLLYISKDTAVPQHTHRGLEMTLILSGKIVDENGVYQAGDLLINSPDDTHTPRTMADEDCLCLSVLSAPLQFKKGLTRLLNPLQQFFY